jgi:hypothetical protein
LEIKVALVQPVKLASLAAVAALLAVLLLSGCARHTWVQAETVATAPDGRIWIAGTEGLAAYIEPYRVVRADYPLGGVPDWARAPSTFPAAQPVVVGAQLLLVTRAGQFFVWTLAGWAPAAVDLGEAQPQVNYAAATRDGRVLLHVHGHRLVWLDPNTQSTVHEEMPQYMEPVRLIGSEVFAVGWQGSGSRRVLRRRDAAGQWSDIALLPTNVTDVRDILRVGGRPAMVIYQGLLVVDDGLQLVSIDDMVEPPKRPLVLAADPNDRAVAPSAAPEPRSTSATDWTVPSARHTILGSRVDSEGRAYLYAVGSHSGIVDLEARRFYVCSLPNNIAGVFRDRDVTRIVTSDAAIFELMPKGTCLERYPGLIPRDP